METAKLSPMPFMAGYSLSDRRQFMVDAAREVEREASEHWAETGARVMGARLIETQNPHSAPKNFKRSPAPFFHTATREEYLELLEIRRSKLAAYRQAVEKLLKGELDVVFPPDCYPPGLPYVPPEDT